MGDITATLAKDGMSMSIERGVIAAFFGNRRVRKELGSQYDGDSSRIVANSRVVNEFKIAESGNTKDGVVYPKDIQLIKLPQKCAGLIEKSSLSYIPTGVNCSLSKDSVHRQFIAILTLKVKTVDQLQEEKKAVPVNVRDWNITDQYDSDDDM